MCFIYYQCSVKYVEIPDRKEAIAYAIHHGEPGDIIVLAGKGHEDYQEIKGKKYPMDERVPVSYTHLLERVNPAVAKSYRDYRNYKLMIGLCALLRGVLRYGKQTCNHFIAFKLLALQRARVFAVLRRLCPAKLEGKNKGDLINADPSEFNQADPYSEPD